MSEIRLNSGVAAVSAAAVGQHLNGIIKREKGTISTEAHGTRIASMESIGGIHERQEIVATLESLATRIGDEYTAQGHDGTKLTASQKLAGALALAASGAPSAWQHKHHNTAVVATEGVKVVMPDDGGPAGSYGYTGELHPSLESFDNSALSDFLGYSVAYNVEAAIQSELPEAFFRTSVVTPENGGADIAIRTPFVFNWSLRGTDGAPQNWNRRRLIEAAFDHTVLADESTTLYPEVKADNSNAGYFVPAAAVAPQTLQVGPRTVRTAPLLVGKEVALINISQGSTVSRNGVADFTDVLDRANGVKNIYLQVGGAGGDVLKFKVDTLPRSMFTYNPEHDGREQNLTFVNSSLALNERTKLASGGAVTNAILADIVADKLQVNLTIRLTGHVNLDTSNAMVTASPVVVNSIYNEDGDQIALDGTEGAAIVSGLSTLTVIGWDPNSRMSNSNKRERGLQLDLQTYVERYPVPMGPPMSIPSPLYENRDPEEMNLLIAAVRTRNDNNAITKLINTAETMLAMNEPGSIGTDANGITQVEGIGRFLLQRHWFRDSAVDAAAITSVSTNDKITDLSAHLVNQLRDGAYEALRTTGLKQALQLLAGSNAAGSKLKLVIGTDPTTARYLFVSGDTRTLGADLDFQVVTTNDRRLNGWIYYAFVVEGEGLNALNFGSHLWTPELISNVTVTRNNAPIREAMVQPRSRHIVTCPILGRIKVDNLSDVVTQKVLFPVKQH